MTAPNPTPTARVWLRPAIALVAILLVAGVLYWRLQAPPRALVGGVISGQAAAADFTLTDQFGQSRAFSSLRGRPIALTFIYTNCPDLCPLIASNMDLAYRKLGDQAKQVALVAVTVDPEFDTVERIRAFSDQRGLTEKWFFLTGTRPELEQVWKAYGIYSEPARVPTVPGHSHAESDPTHGETTPTAGSGQATPQLLEHSSPIFIIDKRGFIRVLLPPDSPADDLVTDLQILLAES